MNKTSFSVIATFGICFAANAAVEIVSPANGTTVALLPEPQKKIMSYATYEERLAVLKADNAKPHDDRYYGKDRDSKWRLSVPLVLKWRTTDGESGPWLIRFGTTPDLADATDTWLNPGEAAKMSMAKDEQSSEKTDGKTHVYTYEMTYANLELGRTYYWKVWSNAKCPKFSHGATVTAKCHCGNGRLAVPSATASFTTEDQPPRWIRLEGRVKNVRDLGGWKTTDGRRVRQGMAFRGSGLNESSITGDKLGRNRLTAEDISYMKDVLGIRTDLDLRTERETAKADKSPLGDGVALVSCPFPAYEGLFVTKGFNEDLCPDVKKAMARIFRLFCDKKNYPIYFHCAGGADRTGSLAYVLNGVLGVTEHDVDVDWESTFYPKLPEIFEKHFNKDTWRQEQHFHRGFAAYGDTDTPLQRRIELYLFDCGVTQEEIDRFRAIMLE